jgi:hypothetical protein
MDGRLHGGQHVLRPVLRFAREQGNLLLAALAIGDIAGDL